MSSQWAHTDPSALGHPSDRGLSKYIQKDGLFLRELNKYRLCKQAPTCFVTRLNKHWTTGECAHTIITSKHSLWRLPADYEAGRCLLLGHSLTILPSSFHCKGETSGGRSMTFTGETKTIQWIQTLRLTALTSVSFRATEPWMLIQTLVCLTNAGGICNTPQLSSSTQ